MTINRLSALQRDFLSAFFQRESRFFLTGGAALAGFYLGHRETHDLDLFTVSDAIEEAIGVTNDVARQFEASLEPIQTAPDFRRLLIKRGEEAVVIDLVRDRSPQIQSEKRVINGIRVDAPDEILANKLCALLARSEIRDLVDVRALELAGYRIEDAIPAAARKDSGLTPAQLGWVLSQIKMTDDLISPGNVPVDELRQYLVELVAKLARLAFPHNE